MKCSTPNVKVNFKETYHYAITFFFHMRGFKINISTKIQKKKEVILYIQCIFLPIGPGEPSETHVDSSLLNNVNTISYCSLMVSDVCNETMIAFWISLVVNVFPLFEKSFCCSISKRHCKGNKMYGIDPYFIFVKVFMYFELEQAQWLILSYITIYSRT